MSRPATSAHLPGMENFSVTLFVIGSLVTLVSGLVVTTMLGTGLGGGTWHVPPAEEQ